MINKLKKIFVCGLFLICCFCFSGCGCFGEDDYDIDIKNVSNIDIVPSKQEAEEGDKITLAYTLENGYKLNYFTINGNKIEGNSFTMPGEEVEISADVTKIVYTITYHLDNETSFVTENNIINSYTIGTVADLPLVEKDEYDFEGWYTNEYFENKIESIDEDMYGNLDLYPRLDGKIYSINYHYEGNVTNNNPITYNFNSDTITLSDAIKDDFEFKGWYDNPTFTGNKVTTIPSGSKGVINLYAKFICTKVEDGYRLITNEIDFVEIMSNDDNWDGLFKLTADLDLSNIDAFNLEIGKDINNAFTGIFDGNNKTISNITFENSSSMAISNMKKYAGLFNYVYNATIKNLNYDFNINVKSGMWSDVYVGGLVGFANGNTQIINCHVSDSSITYNSVAQWLYIGSIVGSGGVLTNCTAKNINFDITTNSTSVVGGLVGQIAILDNCKFENSANNYIRVKSMENIANGSDFVVGGLVGNNGYGPLNNITNCHVDILCSIDVTNMSIDGNLYLGGLVGISKEGATNSYSYLNIAGINVNADETTQKYINEIVGFTVENNN